MTAEEPRAGQIVEHYFLWNREQASSRREGAKARPCLIVSVENLPRGLRVTVLPVTTRPPQPGENALAIPDSIKPPTGIDASCQSWLILDEANVFTWPGFDLVPQASGGFVLGTVTAGFFRQVADGVLALRVRGRPRAIERD